MKQVSLYVAAVGLAIALVWGIAPTNAANSTNVHGVVPTYPTTIYVYPQSSAYTSAESSVKQALNAAHPRYRIPLPRFSVVKASIKNLLK